MRNLLAAFLTLVILDCALAADRTPSPKGAEVYIIRPKDGAEVTSPVTMSFGLKGMGIAPAGVAFKNSGHHHLLVDVDPPAGLSQRLAIDAHSLHFGKGQIETEL